MFAWTNERISAVTVALSQALESPCPRLHTTLHGLSEMKPGFTQACDAAFSLGLQICEVSLCHGESELATPSDLRQLLNQGDTTFHPQEFPGCCDSWNRVVWSSREMMTSGAQYTVSDTRSGGGDDDEGDSAHTCLPRAPPPEFRSGSCRWATALPFGKRGGKRGRNTGPAPPRW